MLFVSLFVKLQIYKVDSLFLGQCRAGKGKDILQLGGKQVDLYERTGYDVAFVVKFKSYGDIERVVSRCFAEREKPAVQCSQFIYLIIIWCPEIGGINCAEIRVILFRHFGTEEQTAVLCHADQWLANCDIIPFFHQNTFHVAGDRSGNVLSDCRMVLCERLIADAGILVILLCLCKILVGYDFVFDKRFHPFVFFLRHFVSDAGTLHRVAVCDVVRGNGH